MSLSFTPGKQGEKGTTGRPSHLRRDPRSGATHVDPMTELDFTVTFPTGEERRRGCICFCVCSMFKGFVERVFKGSIPNSQLGQFVFCPVGTVVMCS